MINVCFKCGLNRPDKVIDPDGPYAICTECGHKHPFRQLPLIIICGASGTGKSTAGQHLVRELREVVVLIEPAIDVLDTTGAARRHGVIWRQPRLQS